MKIILLPIVLFPCFLFGQTNLFGNYATISKDSVFFKAYKNNATLDSVLTANVNGKFIFVHKSTIAPSATTFITATATDADYTVTAMQTFTILPNITANRTISFTGFLSAGQELIIWNKNTSANNWTFLTNAFYDAAGNAITTVVNQTVYRFIFDGSILVKTN